MLDISNQVNKFTINNISPKDNFMLKPNGEDGFFAKSAGTIRVYGATDAFANHADVSWDLVTTISPLQGSITISWDDFTGIYLESDTDTVVRICPSNGGDESYYDEVRVDSITDFDNVPSVQAGEENKALRVKSDGTLEWSDLQEEAIVAPFPSLFDVSEFEVSGSSFILEINGSGFLPETQVYIFKGYSSTDVSELQNFSVDIYKDMIAEGYYGSKSETYSNITFFTSDGIVMNGEGHSVQKTDSSTVNPFAFVDGKKIKVCIDSAIQGGIYSILIINPGNKKAVSKSGFYIREF